MGGCRQVATPFELTSMNKRCLIACETSGKVRDGFAQHGWEAWSCDLLDSDSQGGRHYKGDVRNLLNQHWDLMIAFPPCTYLCSSGMCWTHIGFRVKRHTDEALEFVRLLMNVNIRHTAIENPVGIISTRIRKPDQIIQPWQFGHGEVKTTCLWLRNLPPLKPTNIVAGREERLHYLSPSKDRWKIRSETYQGIADAMADQWSPYILGQ